MKNVAIFTAGKAGQRIFSLCEQMEDVNVSFFVDNNPNLYALDICGVSIISPYKLKKYIETKNIDLILVPSDRMVSFGLREYTNQLDKLGVEKYKIVPSWMIRKKEIDKEDIKQLQEIIQNGRYRVINQLQHLQFHIIDNCNLNCRRCQHFSNIAEQNSFADFGKIEMDFKRLRELFDDINTIAILGGEPLLNPELIKYIEMIRSLFNNSRLEVITNGILVRQMSDELISTIKRNDVFVNISYYPVLENSIEDMVRFLTEKGLHFHVGNHIDEFSKKIMLNKDDCSLEELQDRYSNCRDACCTTLREGKIYPCYLPATSFLLNEKYGCDIQQKDSGVDIYGDVTGIEIVERLAEPFEICRHCGNDEMFRWEQTINAKLEDWVI